MTIRNNVQVKIPYPFITKAPNTRERHMQKEDYYARIEQPELRDYGVYLKVDKLLDCQKPLSDMVNADELQFQVVHQVEELWMKLMAYTLVDVIDYLEKADTHRIVTLMGRVHRLMRMMTQQLDLLE